MFISSYVFAPVEQFLFVGLSNGKLFYWKKKNMEQKYLVDKGKDPELVELDAPPSYLHKGYIKCLIYSNIDCQYVLISGSADRTIKLWEPKNAVKASGTGGAVASQGVTSGSACFQTIIGHGGSIIAMSIVSKV